jgi:hypothetical protein
MDPDNDVADPVLNVTGYDLHPPLPRISRVAITGGFQDHDPGTAALTLLVEAV